MANEFVKVTDQNGVDHPVKDLAAFPRSEQAVLGARNSLYVPNKTVTDSDIVMVASEGELSITGQNSGSSAMWVTFSPVSVPKGSFKFKVSGLTASGVTNMQLQTSSGTTVFTVNYEESEVTGNISASADNYKLFIRLAAGADLSEAKVFPQLLQPTDTLNVNSPYAMTNEELTKKVQSILPDNCKIHRYSYNNDTTPKKFSVGSTPLVIIGKHNGGANISVFFVVSNTDSIATIADVGNRFTLTKDADNVFTITSSEAYWSLVFIGDTIPTVTNAS